MSDTLPNDSLVEKALSLGTTYFQSEKYTKAIKIFQKAIELTKSYSKNDIIELRRKHNLHSYPESANAYHPKYIKLLDNRAACWEKLGELERALRDSQKMCYIEPYNLKCYLRRGRLLQRLGKDKDAYKNYKEALQRVQDSKKTLKFELPTKFVQFIQNQKDIVRTRLIESKKHNAEIITHEAGFKRKLIDPKSEQSKRTKIIAEDSAKTESTPIGMDFIKRLPTELLPLIFKDFTSKELVKTMQVSKTWHRRLISLPDLFQVFDLSNITFKQFSQCHWFLKTLKRFQESDHRIQTLRFSSRIVMDELKTLQALLMQLQNNTCTKLVLAIPNTTTRDLVQSIVPDDKLCHSVKDLSVVLKLRGDFEYECDLFSKFNQVKHLEVLFLTQLVPISVTLKNKIITPLKKDDVENLESLSIICNSGKVKRFPFSKHISVFPPNNVTKLIVAGANLRSHDNLHWLRHFNNLKTLWLEDNHTTLSDLMEVLRTDIIFHQLESLIFRESKVNNRFEPVNAEASLYYDNLKNLKELDLMGTSISGLGLSILISCCRSERITKLNIGDCPFIHFRRLKNDNDPKVLSLSHFFNDVSNLEELCLPQSSSIDDNSLMLLSEQVPMFMKLKKLDLSMNPTISGVSIYQFLKELALIRAKPLQNLVIDGCTSVSHITVNSLRASNLVAKVDCVYEREVWNRFGINSYKYRDR
ncbi:hypothetical protein NCAS_0G00350 [Naumovozyma castellii]|uniref:F-box domain-containing protein n=1 Tax=Naumovozyma castellii TaxID=27288 RepID=G0VHN8_NAUCA|nr:hypothetical protein NCAS_0G00350 [Naumovozyma castellii CBS 4309]CCC70922.1 hypothetical protein NCAS_0G00350 [Naumovozyma castellii CBS 4309]